MAEPLISTENVDDPSMSAEEARALRAQIRKWQERIPKLTTAMRQRSEALAAARLEIRVLRRRQVAQAQQGDRVERDSLERERSSLAKRNQQLFETLQVTNQQLAHANSSVRELRDALSACTDENNRLATRLAELERLQQDWRQPEDELTLVRGIGAKLAEQLRDGGVGSLKALADLTEELLADEAHPLHGLRGRFARDGWSRQASDLLVMKEI